jgi:hypothetical protein
MSVTKTTTTTALNCSQLALSEVEKLILKIVTEVAIDANKYDSCFDQKITSSDVIAHSIEEVVALLEFRKSLKRDKVDRIKTLRNKFKKTFN